MQVKICHDLFPYLWECLEIGLKTSCKGEFLLEIPLGRHTGASSRQQQHSLGKQPGGAQAGHVPQRKSSFHCSPSCPGVIQCAGLTRLHDKARFT